MYFNGAIMDVPRREARPAIPEKLQCLQVGTSEADQARLDKRLSIEEELKCLEMGMSGADQARLDKRLSDLPKERTPHKESSKGSTRRS